MTLARSPTTRILLILNLSLPGHAVHSAETGEAGLLFCESHRVDCVITELTLPDMSGFQVLLQLVPRAYRPEIAVIFLTDTPFEGMERIALNNGAQAYLIKNRISGDQLDKAIHKALVTVALNRKEVAHR